jgi:hypothetical protein
MILLIKPIFAVWQRWAFILGLAKASFFSVQKKLASCSKNIEAYVPKVILPVFI